MRKIDCYIKRSIIAGVLSFFVAFAAVFIFMPAEKDFFSLQLTPEGIDNYNVLYHTEKSEENAASAYTISPFMYLTEGEYTVTMQYNVTEDVPLYVYYMSEYDTETDAVPKHLLGNLESGKSESVFSFSLDDTVKHVLLVMDYQGNGTVKLENCQIKSTAPIFNNRMVSAVTVALAAMAFAVTASLILSGKSDDKKEKFTVLLLASAMVIVSSAGLIKWDVILGDDLEFHLLRILGIAENAMAGAPMSKVNFAFNGGYGYLNNVFYPQLFLWPFAVMVMAGADVICAYKLLLFAINIATVAIAYLCFKNVSGCRIAAVVATAVYALNYYRIGNIYIRAALGELLYLVFLPVVFCGIYEIFHNREEKWYILAIGATCVLQSHILGTLLTAIGGAVLIGYYLIVSLLSKGNIVKQFTALVKAVVTVVGVNIWFLIPMIYYIRQPFSMFDNIDSVERFYSYSQSVYDMLFRTGDFTYHTLISHMGIGTGIFFVTVIAAVVFYMVKTKKLHESAGLAVIAVILLICAADIMPWDKLGQIGLVEMVITKLQFSFRLNTLTIMFLSFAAAVLLKDIRIEKAKLAGVVFVCLLVVLGGRYYNLPGYESMRGYDGSFTISGLSPPEYLMQEAAYHNESPREDKFRTSSDDIEITDYRRTGGGLQVVVENNSSAEGYIEVPLMYYSGYEAQSLSDGSRLQVTTGENFVVRVVVPQGVQGEIAVKYAGKWFFAAANVLSAAFTALVVLLVWGGPFVKKRKCKK